MEEERGRSARQNLAVPQARQHRQQLQQRRGRVRGKELPGVRHGPENAEPAVRTEDDYPPSVGVGEGGGQSELALQGRQQPPGQVHLAQRLKPSTDRVLGSNRHYCLDLHGGQVRVPGHRRGVRARGVPDRPGVGAGEAEDRGGGDPVRGGGGGRRARLSDRLGAGQSQRHVVF